MPPGTIILSQFRICDLVDFVHEIMDFLYFLLFYDYSALFRSGPVGLAELQLRR